MKTSDGLWRLSPSGLYGFTECPSCFWIANHYMRVPMLPLLLNSAMDSVLKARYDKYRVKGEFPPEASELKERGMKPFADLEKLNDWRENINALKVVDEKAGYVLVGKIDDVLVDAKGRLVPADYKSSGNAPADDKQKYYRDQLAAYGFMFKQQGREVSEQAFLLHYYVADKNDPSIDVKFKSHVDPVAIDIGAIEKKIRAMVKLLNGKYPGHNPDCKNCAYHDGREKLFSHNKKQNGNKKS